MRILYGVGFDGGERVKFLPKIGFNMMEGLQVLCQAVIDLELESKLTPEAQPLWEQLLQEPVVFQAPDKRCACPFLKLEECASTCSVQQLGVGGWSKKSLNEAYAPTIVTLRCLMLL